MRSCPTDRLHVDSFYLQSIANVRAASHHPGGDGYFFQGQIGAGLIDQQGLASESGGGRG